MFEDETIDIACPHCGYRTSLLVVEVEATAESHIICKKCNAGIKIDTRDFQQRLDQIRKELEEMERNARSTSRGAQRRTKDDYQI